MSSQPKIGGNRRGNAGKGRPKGSLNKKTAEKIAAVEASGLMPLDYMLSLLRDDTLPPEERFKAAKEAAPYLHPRLASIDHTGEHVKRFVVAAPAPTENVKEWLEQQTPDLRH